MKKIIVAVCLMVGLTATSVQAGVDYSKCMELAEKLEACEPYVCEVKQEGIDFIKSRTIVVGRTDKGLCQVNLEYDNGGNILHMEWKHGKEVLDAMVRLAKRNIQMKHAASSGEDVELVQSARQSGDCSIM